MMRFKHWRILALCGVLVLLPALSCPAGAQTKDARADSGELHVVVEPIPDEFRKGGLSQDRILETIAEAAGRNGIKVRSGPANPESAANDDQVIVKVSGSCDSTRLCYLDLTLSLKTPKEILRTTEIGEPVVRSNTKRILSMVREMFEHLLAE